MPPFVPPFAPNSFSKSAFNCPWCGAFAQQNQQDVWVAPLSGRKHELLRTVSVELTDTRQVGPADTKAAVLEYWQTTECAHCKRVAVWNGPKMVYPTGSTAPMPHEDLPESCRADYLEARDVLALSPRSAAALLRLVTQKLLKELGGKGENINNDIAALVEKGLPVEVRNALDVCRVVGNNGVHPGELDLNDTPELAASLFNVINIIVERMITSPRELERLYQALPASSLAAIEKRDSRKPS